TRKTAGHFSKRGAARHGKHVAVLQYLLEVLGSSLGYLLLNRLVAVGVAVDDDDAPEAKPAGEFFFELGKAVQVPDHIPQSGQDPSSLGRHLHTAAACVDEAGFAQEI